MGNSQSDYADFVKASGETQHHKTEKKYLYYDSLFYKKSTIVLILLPYCLGNPPVSI